MIEDWRYNKDKLKVRDEALITLLKELGSQLDDDKLPLHSSKQIYACAHDWVSHGNMNVDGLLNFYHEHYETRDEELSGEHTTEQHSEDT